MCNSENQLIKTENLLTKEIPKETENIREFYDYWGFYISKGVYWCTEQKGKKSNEVRISNFIMEILYHLNDGTNNTKRIIKLQKDNGDIFLKEVLSNEMTPDKFEVILKSSGCTFKGSSFQLKSIFEFLMKNEIDAKTINSLGYQKELNIYAFADSIINKKNELLKINELGIIKNNDNLYYLPAFSKANLDNDYFSYDRNFAYKQGNLDFSEWSKLVYETFGINGAIGINYAIACIFRDIIFNELKFFPFLFLFGQYGTGKTSYIESVLHLFGSHTIGTPLSNVTVSALSRETSQRINSLFYYKEFTVENSGVANPFILNAYDGSGRTIGEKSTDNKTKKFLPQSGIVFDGNYLPIQKDSVFSRLILLMFEENKFTEKQKNSFRDLAQNIEKGLNQVLKEILSFRKHFEENFKNNYKEMLRQIDELQDYKDVPSRLKNHSALIISIYETLKEKIKFPYQPENLVKSVIDYMSEQNYMLDEIKDISNFWKAAEYFVNKGILIENKDFIKEQIFDLEGNIFIKYDAFHTCYVKYCNENQLNRVDKISLKTLLTSKVNKSFVPHEQKSRKGKAIIKYKFGSCYQFCFTNSCNNIIINNLELNI